jgi:hypothetical protein
MEIAVSGTPAGKTTVLWSHIIHEAAQCGKMRLSGLEKEADAREARLQKLVHSADAVILDVPDVRSNI